MNIIKLFLKKINEFDFESKVSDYELEHTLSYFLAIL